MVLQKENSDSDEKSFLESISSITNYQQLDARRDLPSERASTIANIFWRPQLTFHPYVCGDDLVDFDELWPADDYLTSILESLSSEDMREVAMDCCKLVLRCGPVRVLERMIEKKIVAINDVFDNGRSLLHVACLACNPHVVAFLCEKKIDARVKDNNGYTAAQVCYDEETRKALSLPLKVSSGKTRGSRKRSQTYDPNVFFDMCDKPSLFDELMAYIQTQDFNVTENVDQNGNFLIHTAVQGGIAQLSLVIVLVRVFGADVEAVNRISGMTPLCLAAKLGMEVIVDVLICLLGADPNARNTVNGWTPLHFAAKENRLDTVDCLLKRGADVNLEFTMEDYSLLPDDIASMHRHLECKRRIQEHRSQRCAHLSRLAFLGNLSPKDLRHTDLFNIDSGDKTLLMAAAAGNRCDNLNVLFKYKDCPINGQHSTSGATALTYAATGGHLEAVQTLFNHGAVAGIRDVSGLLPLHYACKGGHVEVVKEFISREGGLTGLVQAYDLCPSDDLKELIRFAMKKRENELVNPVLFECSMTGDASKIYCLLEEGDDMNPLTSSKDWPAYLAVGNGHLEVLQLLHERGGNICRVHPRTGSTLLHVACSRGLTDMTRYLLDFTKSFEKWKITPAVAMETGITAIDINAVDSKRETALQIAASKGYAEIVKLLLSNNASSAVLNKKGSLYQCEQFDGVQAVIENHRKSRTDDIMLSIKDKKRFKYLQKHWQPKFDHNLRDRLGNTPLMLSCLSGRVPVVKFLLETAIQDQDDGTTDMEKSMRLRYNSTGDCSGFLESYASYVGQVDNSESSCTDYSDQEGAASPGYKSHPCPRSTSTPRASNEDLRKYHIPEGGFPNRHISRRSVDWSRGSGSEAERGRRRFRRWRKEKGHLSDSEVGLSDEGGGGSRQQDYAPRLAPIRSTSLSNLQPGQVSQTESENPVSGPSAADCPGTRSSTLPRSYGAALVDAGESDVSRLYLSHGHPQGPLLIQGNVINHLYATNPYDGRSPIHRAIECTDLAAGAHIVGLLLKKDPEIVNLQDRDGFAPLHLTCQLERQKIIKKLLSSERLILNMRTRDGRLPEEMTTSTKMRKLLDKAKQNSPLGPENKETRARRAPSVSSCPSMPSTIDFDRLDQRFKDLRTPGDVSP